MGFSIGAHQLWSDCISFREENSRIRYLFFLPARPTSADHPRLLACSGGCLLVIWQGDIEAAREAFFQPSEFVVSSRGQSYGCSIPFEWEELSRSVSMRSKC